MASGALKLQAVKSFSSLGFFLFPYFFLLPDETMMFENVQEIECSDTYGDIESDCRLNELRRRKAIKFKLNSVYFV